MTCPRSLQSLQIIRNNSCKNNDSDYDDDDSTMIYWAFTWAKPFKDFNLVYFLLQP